MEELNRKKKRISDTFRSNVYLSLNPVDCSTLLKVLKVIVFLRETCNELYLLLCNLCGFNKNVVFSWKKKTPMCGDGGTPCFVHIIVILFR